MPLSVANGSSKAIYTVFLSLGSLVGGLCGGYIVDVGGLPWIHWTNVILAAVMFVLCFLFQAETLYDRPQTTVQLSNDTNKPNVETKESVIIADTAVPSPSYPPFTYMRSLKLATYRPGVVRHFAAPYKTMRLPGVWLVSLWYAGLVGLIVILSLVGTQLVAAPPYMWGKGVGLINIGGLIGALLGCVSSRAFEHLYSVTNTMTDLYLLPGRFDNQASCEERQPWFL
jgi:MFS family permease